MYTMRVSSHTKYIETEGFIVERMNFQLWLTDEDAARYAELRIKARERQPFSKDSDLNRRLLGLDKGQELLTDAEVSYFRGQAERPKTIVAERIKSPKKVARKKGTNDSP